MPIHPAAIVDRAAEIDPTAEIGAYAIVEGGVHVAASAKIWPHAYLFTGARLDAGVQVHPFAVVGHAPQDLKYSGAPTYAHVGAGSIIREHASVHRGTAPESATIVGKHVFLMAGAHVGHNCAVGDHVILANNVLLAGHVQIGERAFLGGGAGIHQFSRIGAYAMIRGNGSVAGDVPPFMMFGVEGIAGINLIGMRRNGFASEERDEIKEIFRRLYRSRRMLSAVIPEVIALARTRAGRMVAEFLQTPAKRTYVRLARRGRAADETE